MKQKLHILFLFLTPTICFSQDLISGGSNSWIFHTPDDGRTTLHIAPLINNSYNFGYQTVFYNNGDVAFSSNVGIGTVNPTLKFEVVGNEATNFDAAGFFNTKIYGNVNDKCETRINLGKIEGSNKQSMGAIGAFPSNNTDSSNGILVFYTRESQLVLERLRIISNGNVGIGITNPTNKLDVNGTIHSKEVKVDMNGWSDFVFKKEYNLPSLKNVEKHITKKGHLENIPSEEEVLKNGINLGEMNAKLLQKIEELTLYIIQQEKKNNLQTLEIENSKNEIETLKKENESFKSILERLSKIEEKLK